MAELVLRGSPASPGAAIGGAWRHEDPAANGHRVAPEHRAQETRIALAALAGAGEALTALAATLRRDEAQILEAGAMMAGDPALSTAVQQAIEDHGQSAVAAIIGATAAYADAIAAVGDETLAARADDVRSLGRRAVAIIAGEDSRPSPGSDVILVAHDIGPADVAELAPALAGVALVGGGTTAHAAIVARSLGVPMVTGLPEQILAIADGEPLALDGAAGTVVLEPSWELAAFTSRNMHARRSAESAACAEAGRPAVTSDGARVTVLANVASAGEVSLALRTGAEGVGLLRTELAFLDAASWPSEQEHIDALTPILEELGARRAVVRVLDFGADKAPPFLRGEWRRGIDLLLANEHALLAQLRAIVRLSVDHDIWILLPMVDHPRQVALTGSFVELAAIELAIADSPPLGSMIETPLAAGNAEALAACCSFLSIGTNDLTATTLGTDRVSSSAGRAHDPRVLALIASTVAAARAANIPIEVCGEAASDPIMLPLLIGLGVRELSVGAAQVGAVRGRVRQLDSEDLGRLASSAVALESAEEVERSVEQHGAAQVGL